jgi:hypothetical protein
MNEQELQDVLKQAITTGNGEQLRDYSQEMELLAEDVDHFPPSSFDLILTLMLQQTFLEMEGSHGLLLLFEYTWAFLSDDQKDRLLPVLESTYGRFTDWLSWFVITELLGKYFGDDRALMVLHRLRALESEVPRSLVPQGLQHIVKSSSDKDLARRAYEELLQMKNDPSEEVRGEVDISLQILANRGYKCD